MDEKAIRKLILDALRNLAPETDPGKLADDVDIREELDLDSMDFLNFVTAVHEASGIEIPESDHKRLATVGGAVSYLESKK